MLNLNTVDVTVTETYQFVEVTKKAIRSAALVEWFRCEGFMASPFLDTAGNVIGISYHPNHQGHLSETISLGSYVAVSPEGKLYVWTAEVMKRKLAGQEAVKTWRKAVKVTKESVRTKEFADWLDDAGFDQLQEFEDMEDLAVVAVYTSTLDDATYYAVAGSYLVQLDYGLLQTYTESEMLALLEKAL